MGLIFGILLLISAIGMMKKRLVPAYLGILLTLFLDAFFTYRWLHSFKFMPSGHMSIISFVVLVLISLLIRRERTHH